MKKEDQICLIHYKVLETDRCVCAFVPNAVAVVVGGGGGVRSINAEVITFG